MEPTEPTNLPKLPGYSVPDAVSDKPAYHKTQTLLWRHGYSVVCQPPNQPTLTQPAHRHPLAEVQPTEGAREGQNKKSEAISSASTPSSVPKWIQYERQVLRFYAYFKEEVPHSFEEPWRARKVSILYYLEDDTIQVEEPKEGSGILQGTLVARQHIAIQQPNQSSSSSISASLNYTDITIGKPVVMYAREYHILDADAFTREFLKGQGREQPPALPYPINPLDAYKAEKQKPSGLSKTDPQSPTRYAEALMGKAPSSKKLQQFLEGNNQVLRFFCVWDDPALPTGAVRRPYKLHYFLEDDTVEIVELQEGNGGRSFYHFLKRAPLPRTTSPHTLGDLAPPQALYRSTDFRIGCKVSVHGRHFLIHDADSFTKIWLATHLGCGQEELAAIDVSQPKPTAVVAPLPPCIKLIPKAPKRDISRWMQPGIEHTVLRFTTKLVAAPGKQVTKVDGERRFVLSFYVADDTLAIYEPPQPNTGVVGGKYLERCKVHVAGSSEVYGIKDLKVGRQLQLHGRLFELLAADAFTETYLQGSTTA